jgi:hypothetical protein
LKAAQVFFRRRTVWVPTFWGWLALFLVLIIAVIGAVRSVYPFLAVTQPVGASVLVVEGWLGREELDSAIAIFKAGGYQQIVTTGGPLQSWPRTPTDSTAAHRAAEYLKRRGLATVPITPAPSPLTLRDRTYTSALMVRAWAQRSGIDLKKLDVVSRGPHARRSQLLYRLAFGPDVQVGVFAIRPPDYNPARWWRTSTGARDVAEQAMGLIWVKLFFDPSKRPAAWDIE